MRDAIHNATAGLLLLLHAWIVVDLSECMSITYNESSHIVAGLACWHTGAYDFYNVNPPLPRMVSTAALLGEPSICLESLGHIGHQPAARDELEMGTFFADTNALDMHRIVYRSRLAGVFWITLGGVLVWRWAHSLYGAYGGLLTLALWTFEPTITAHAALVTGDVPAAVMGLAATYAFWLALRSGSHFHAVAAGILLGFSLLCKFTLLLLLPAWIIAWLLAARCKERYAVHSLPSTAQLRRAVAIGFLAWFTLNAWYEFRGTGTRIGELPFFSKLFVESQFMQNSFVRALPCPLPTDYVSGIDIQQRDFEGRLDSYLCGEWRSHGWWYYYFYAFAIKSPLGHLAVYSIAAIAARALRPSLPTVLWVVPVLIVAAASLKTGYTNHLRYILPAYPYIVIMSGSLVANPVGKRIVFRKLLGAMLVLWSAVSMWSAYPNLLGYFNESIGGVEQGWRHLAQSNVDWGQDWIALREWLETHPGERPLRLALVGVVDPSIYLGERFPAPGIAMSGYAVVDAQNLTRDYSWLLNHPLVARVGSSIFVFEVRP